MKTKKLLSVCGMALLLAGWGTIPEILAQEQSEESKITPQLNDDPQADVEAQVTFNQSLRSARGVDIYRLQCLSPRSACAFANVRDIGPHFDVNFRVCLQGGGAQSCRTSPQGGQSGFARLCLNRGTGRFQDNVFIFEANRRGPERYRTRQTCTDRNGFEVNHRVIFLQDQ